MTWTATDPYGQSASIDLRVTVEPAEKPAYPHSCTPGTEQSLAMGDSIRGTAAPLPQSDCFAIEVGTGQGSGPFRVTAYTVGDTDTEGALLDSDYDVIDINYDGGQDSNFQVAGRVEAGRYIVVVHGEYGARGEYLLKADDHGDSPATATPVADSAGGSLATPGNVDFFQVFVAAAGLLEVSTSGSVNTQGTLYDDLGDVLATDDDGGQGTNFLMRQEVQPGDYYVRVEGSTNGSYVFRVEGAGVRPGPDLAFTGVRPSEMTIRRGGPEADMYFTVANVGDGPLEPGEVARLFVSSDADITASDVELEYYEVLDLFPGETEELSFSLEISPNTPLGTVYFGMCADPAAGESNTDNNCSALVKVTIVDASGQAARDRPFSSPARTPP